MVHINWGLIGCGWVARDYVAPAMQAAGNGRLVGLCDPNQAAMARVAAATPGVACFNSVDALLAMPELDAVYIATPNHLHAPLVEAAARAGKHVLCEKPMATTMADARRMVQACESARVQYATAFDQRFQARHQRLRQLIADGRLGTITSIRIHYACWTPGDWRPQSDDGNYDNWRVDPTRAGGGAFIDLAPHGLDLSQVLLGERLVEVACLMQRRVFHYPVDDGAALVGRFAGGALLTLNVAYNCPDAFPRRRLEVIGTAAMALAHNTMGQTPGGTLQLIHSHGEAEEISIAPTDDCSPFQTQLERFSQCLLEGRPFPFLPAHDLHTMELLSGVSANHLTTENTENARS
ncbi:MAG: Gfo/Idh/MocA family oxidoreductase [Chloroflexaceae bacterium]|jgi:predicted dehydrogenase|nr:Gfo/Idh/MocA family oxidoreductase [Chloroflexaceae bacterium]